VSQPIRYRPMFKDRDARMVVDMSGDWTSLSCYYLLHDSVERLRGQVEYYTAALGKQEVLNQRLVKAGDAMAAIIKPPAHGPGEWDGEYDEWLAAKETRP
jgi:hypothetical protein